MIELGYEVILLNPKHVKAYLKGNKNDFNDARLTRKQRMI